ncbi:nuclear transport factor 2 family protein [Eubacteriales bacterium OttesenSCG-928-M02]|nr:nuclear transport factor 2 family protein [Eubacteriales bacterium OttesenSCG-928-M02]
MGEALLYQYMKSWEHKDIVAFLATLHKDVVIVECYGPIYQGMEEAKAWFSAWNQEGRVIRWQVMDIYKGANPHMFFATWHFTYEHPWGKRASFSGMSMLETDGGKIRRLREYRMQAAHYRPYQK